MCCAILALVLKLGGYRGRLIVRTIFRLLKPIDILGVSSSYYKVTLVVRVAN
jgi:hypothetical protein